MKKLNFFFATFKINLLILLILILSGDSEKNSCNPVIQINGCLSQLWSSFKWILFWSSPRSLWSDSELLSNRKTSLPNGRLWTIVWRGTWILGIRFKSGEWLIDPNKENPINWCNQLINCWLDQLDNCYNYWLVITVATSKRMSSLINNNNLE